MKVNAMISYTVVSKELYITRTFISYEPHFTAFRSVINNIFTSGLVIVKCLNENIINYKYGHVVGLVNLDILTVSSADPSGRAV